MKFKHSTAVSENLKIFIILICKILVNFMELVNHYVKKIDEIIVI